MVSYQDNDYIPGIDFDSRGNGGENGKFQVTQAVAQYRASAFRDMVLKYRDSRLARELLADMDVITRREIETNHKGVLRILRARTF